LFAIDTSASDDFVTRESWKLRGGRQITGLDQAEELQMLLTHLDEALALALAAHAIPNQVTHGVHPA
jgi:hypothetical protein